MIILSKTSTLLTFQAKLAEFEGECERMKVTIKQKDKEITELKKVSYTILRLCFRRLYSRITYSSKCFVRPLSIGWKIGLESSVDL